MSYVIAAEALLKEESNRRSRLVHGLDGQTIIAEQQSTQSFIQDLPNWAEQSLYLENICACILHRRVSLHTQFGRIH
jgi:hypothetical protein